jgi:hypothetical protein
LLQIFLLLWNFLSLFLHPTNSHQPSRISLSFIQAHFLFLTTSTHSDLATKSVIPLDVTYIISVLFCCYWPFLSNVLFVYWLQAPCKGPYIVLFIQQWMQWILSAQNYVLNIRKNDYVADWLTVKESTWLRAQSH